MLAATVSAWLAAWTIRATWPSWRLPMVGTKASRPMPGRAARKLSIVAWICMFVRLVAVFLGREAAVLHRRHVGGHRRVDAGRAVHEVFDEAGLLARIDPQQVVQHQHLAVAVLAGADAD